MFNCSQCIFSMVSDVDKGIRCRRFPPNAMNLAFPRVSVETWCGEFKLDEEKAKAILEEEEKMKKALEELEKEEKKKPKKSKKKVKETARVQVKDVSPKFDGNNVQIPNGAMGNISDGATFSGTIQL